MHLEITTTSKVSFDVNLIYIEYVYNKILYFNIFDKKDFESVNKLDLVNKKHDKALKC